MAEMMRKGLEPGSGVYLVVYEAERSRVHAREGNPVALQLLSSAVVMEEKETPGGVTLSRGGTFDSASFITHGCDVQVAFTLKLWKLEWKFASGEEFFL